MAEDVVIALKNVSKCFKQYAKPIDRLNEFLLPGKIHAQEFWALRDINLEVEQGETLGIIGQNGSGKSTLLQIIAGTLTPTTGDVNVKGRVSALLELGSGFNPEFTGRQNVFFNGKILGLSQAEVESRFDEIAAFAEIGDFIDQPVKTYSSGMFVRLAFSVAVSTNPGILVVDEALSVGDIFFQQKCFRRIRDMKDSGVTLLFVSHDSTAVYKLCSRAILLETGKTLLDAKPKQVIDLYEAKLYKKLDAQPDMVAVNIPASQVLEQDLSDGLTSQVAQADLTSPAIRVKFIRFLDEEDKDVHSITSDQVVQISIGLLFLEELKDPHVGFKVRGRTGEVIFEINTFCLGQIIGMVTPDTLLETRFKFKVPLREGDYSITVGAADGGYGDGQFERVLLYYHSIVPLKVLKNIRSPQWAGLVNLSPSVSLHRSSSSNHLPQQPHD